MRRGRTGLAALLCAGLLLESGAGAWADGDDGAACGRAARDAEGAFGLPEGILAAIGSVESGNWPWTANIDGVGETYRSKAEAVEALTRVRSPRPADVDVGCFQISLHYHPAAFATIAEALDPAANARYAARFLQDLRERYGDWDRAIGAYHSATDGLEAGYRERVLAQWKGGPGQDKSKVADIEVKPRWRVISVSAALVPAGRLPRIITLGN